MMTFINGEFLTKDESKISIFDRGVSYGDAIYEVVLIYNRKAISLQDHLNRLQSCAKEMYLYPDSNEQLSEIVHQLLEKNPDIANGMLFIHLTRGVMFERYTNPLEMKNNTLMMYITPLDMKFDAQDIVSKPYKALLMNDPRKYRNDIKSTSLMPTALAKIEAIKAGYDYAIFKNPITGHITEGMSSNLFIVTHDNEIWTHPLNCSILEGTLRNDTIKMCKAEGLIVKEIKFSEKELFEAKEVFVTGSIKLFKPIIQINGIDINNQKIGNIVTMCCKKYIEFIN